MAAETSPPKLPSHLVHRIMSETHALREAEQPAVLLLAHDLAAVVFRESDTAAVCLAARFSHTSFTFFDGSGDAPPRVRLALPLDADGALTARSSNLVRSMALMLARRNVHEGTAVLGCILTSVRVVKELLGNHRVDQWRMFVQQQPDVRLQLTAEAVTVGEAGQDGQMRMLGTEQLALAMDVAMDYVRMTL